MSSSETDDGMIPGAIVCVTLLAGDDVIGVLSRAWSPKTSVWMTGPFLVREDQGTVTMKRYNMYSSAIEDEIVFMSGHILSMYRCSPTVEEFYRLHLNTRSRMELVEKNAPRKSRTLNPRPFDIQDIRNNVIRITNGSEDGEDEK